MLDVTWSSPATAGPWTAKTSLSVGHWINGQAHTSESGSTFDVVNPATGKVFATIADGGAHDVEKAVVAARKALSGEWSKVTPSARGELIRRVGQALTDNSEELGLLETSENGRLLRDTKAQLKLIRSWFDYFGGLSDKFGGDVIPTDGGSFVYTKREPKGVIGMVVPWNAPLMLLALKLPAALAAGCTVVVKPSQYAPVALARFAELAEEAGLPPGVFNVVHGRGRASTQALIAADGISHISFTGSTSVGREVAAAAGSRLISTTLELGGKSPQIVFEDADLDAAAKGIVAGGFTSSGQACFAGTRVYAHEAVAEQLASKIASIISSVKMGDPLEPTTELGPIANQSQYDRVHEYLALARDEGAVFAGDGNPAPDGLFIRPVLLQGVEPQSRLVREEIFGPLVVIASFADEDEAVRLANDSEFGLAAGVWTQRLDRAHRVSARLEAGTVWVNTYRALSPMVPFGGAKSSGLGRENGVHALDEFTSIKAVWMQLDGSALRPFGRTDDAA
ncbi:aldehyde dehydrogenase family protein [Paenarthrobacter sp. NPDC058040]|uniref:aldehyde dehydrogenase family protein n=1 Tax=unclassified Paenarthrobacter TaxID=2634190 RepID=UPI0036DB0442